MPKPVFYPHGYFPAVSNTERQRQFRERNPGYYQRLHAKRRARLLTRRAELEAAAAAQAAVATPEPVLLTLPIPTFRLALPAPVEDPTLAAIEAIQRRRAMTMQLVMTGDTMRG